MIYQPRNVHECLPRNKERRNPFFIFFYFQLHQHNLTEVFYIDEKCLKLVKAYPLLV